jgi:hypothetical protein
LFIPQKNIINLHNLKKRKLFHIYRYCRLYFLAVPLHREISALSEPAGNTHTQGRNLAPQRLRTATSAPQTNNTTGKQKQQQNKNKPT